MSSIIILAISLLFLSLLIKLPPIAATDGDVETAALSPYKILQSYGFPKGILPKGAKGYSLDESTGKFKAFLNGSCSFSLEGSYELRYKSTIGGTISKNKLTNLSGVSVRILFVWINIVEVSRDDDELDFSVGIAAAGFPIDNFDISPQCGCGLNCNGEIENYGNGQVRKIRSNPFVSSM